MERSDDFPPRTERLIADVALVRQTNLVNQKLNLNPTFTYFDACHFDLTRLISFSTPFQPACGETGEYTNLVRSTAPYEYSDMSF